MNIRTLISPACSGHRNSDSFDGFRRSFYRLLIGHVAVTSSTVASVPLPPSLPVLPCADRSPRRPVRAVLSGERPSPPLAARPTNQSGLQFGRRQTADAAIMSLPAARVPLRGELRRPGPWLKFNPLRSSGEDVCTFPNHRNYLEPPASDVFSLSLNMIERRNVWYYVIQTPIHSSLIF